MKPKKCTEISDEMVGRADPICFCAATVAEIIRTKNIDKGKQRSLRAIKEKIEKKGKK